MAASSPDIVPSDAIAGVVVIYPLTHEDDRGRFAETYRRSWFPDGREMVQANRSEKVAGSVVGLHYHLEQADYWFATSGTARVVLHDLREGSPTDGVTVCFDMGGAADVGVYIPPGVAHGFAALTDLTITYLVDHYYSPDDELGVAWDDPTIAADWGVTDPVLSTRDQKNPTRDHIPPGFRPLLGPAPPPAVAEDVL
ncbi:MAG: dTDP-4-dehydrorhamnose 3,5-epimerase family protein [Actinobacteria bacterium]|nr:dTDP-4-dehydrorhamnose 3,5-epimerase family protein [Actinomycetota bacterium]